MYQLSNRRGYTGQIFRLETAITILQQCTAGMHHLHSLGIIHRDFRAANILVAGRDPMHVVVADFGVSHQLRVYAQVRSRPPGMTPVADGIWGYRCTYL